MFFLIAQHSLEAPIIFIRLCISEGFMLTLHWDYTVIKHY
jgi:hypothetical protein